MPSQDEIVSGMNVPVEERAERIARDFPATPYIDEQWKEKIADEIRTAVEAQKEIDAEACIDRWRSEPDHTRRNTLSHGCIASAAAIRAGGNDVS